MDDREQWLREHLPALASRWFVEDPAMRWEILAIESRGRLGAVTVRSGGHTGYSSYIFLVDFANPAEPRHLAVYVPEGERYGLHSSVDDAQIALPRYWPPTREDMREAVREHAGLPAEWKPTVLRNLAVAIPLLLTAAAFFAAWRSGWFAPGMTRVGMSKIMQLEFFAVHAGVFIGLVVAWQPEDRAGRITRWVFFALLVAMYLAFALNIGLWAAAGFFALVLGTYLGWMLNRRAPSAIVELAVRWAAMFFLFMGIGQACNLPTNVDHWLNNSRTLPFGAWYFLGLGLLEASGLYQHPVWARLSASSRRSTHS